MKSKKYFIGIDEAGRGPLAGPVAVGAFAIKSKKTLKKFPNIKDSKQLSERQREEWFKLIKSLQKAGELAYAVCFSSEVTIDEKGMTRAVSKATSRCLARLQKKAFCDPGATVLLDGLLRAPKHFLNQQTIIGGDESEPLIALASICAKVLRDRKMTRISKKYPGYGFEIHKGYGTKMHINAIRKLGTTPIHRVSFLSRILASNEF